MPVNRVHHTSLLVFFQHGEALGHGPYLIAPELFIRRRAGEHVPEIPLLRNKELFYKGFLHKPRQLAVIPGQPQLL